jgi:Prealbumin-like fold domain
LALLSPEPVHTEGELMKLARSRRSAIRPLLLVTAVLGLVLAYVLPASASHPEVSLPGSNFEIDTDANLKVDDPAPSTDWANVTEARKADTASGPTDESFGQGTKEDTAVPSVVDGSIPPNKSDLKFFGVYQEGGSSSGFLNLYWSRVQDPTGTTNMDFEFNQSTTTSANGVTPVRTAGDLLIIYDLAQGGTRPVLSLRTWTGSAWGPATNLTASNKATGSINTSPIPGADADGLGAHSARTFGEAQLALSALFPDPSVCKSFGSAYLKSRSSDSFTAALKDFVPPVGVNISNCGSIKIIKQDDAGDPLVGAEFTLYKDNTPTGGTRGTEDTITTHTCTTGADGTCTITNIPQGQYWVVETKTPANHDSAADQHATVAPDTTVELTFVNPRQPGSVKITKLDDASPPHPLAGAEFTLYKDNAPIGGTRGAEDTITSKTCTTGADGTCEITNVVPGEYWVVETVTPTGHDSAADQHVTVKANEQVSVTFVNVRQLGSVKITKTDDADPANPLAGAEFTLYEDNSPTGGTRGDEDVATNKTCTTGSDGTCTITGVLPGQYWVVETKTPANHDSAADQHVTVTANEQASVSFVDPRHRGAILVTKTRKHAADGPGDHPQAGVDFTVNGVTKTTDTNGKACFDGLLFGSYTVHETTPSGYQGEGDKTVAVDNKAACADDPYVGETVSFSNTPLSNITVSFESQVPGGTASKISCTGLTADPADATPNVFDDVSETFKDLEPGTYSCTVVVDP